MYVHTISTLHPSPIARIATPSHDRLTNNDPPVCLRPTTQTLPPSRLLLPLTQKATLTEAQAKRAKEALRTRLDPYREALRLERVARNVARRKELTVERTVAHGDPIQGLPTPFLESFDSAGQAATSPARLDGEGKPIAAGHALPTSPHILNYRLTQAEVDEAVAESYELTAPVEGGPKSALVLNDPGLESLFNSVEGHEARHFKAVETLRRITTLDNACSRDRRFANIRRIVDEFGRHNTDATVRQKGLAWNRTERVEKIRGGPDTGSSEVQIAILTAKIRVLAKMYAGPKGNKDKHNKRNLRLLLHRRQKLLKYMQRRERGSGRWQHMIETLGLSPATWEGQIEVR